MKNTIIKLFNTLRHLKLTQLVFFIRRRKFTASSVSYAEQPSLRADVFLSEPISVSGIRVNVQSFCFLNQVKDFSLSVDWLPTNVTRLWAYNLHYFDYLRELEFSVENNSLLLLDWVKHNQQGMQPGWEPFTTSLRIVNWIFYFVREPTVKKNELIRSLYTQALWLEKNDERHILANHYFENLKALTFAGVFFTGKDAQRWLKHGIAGVTSQLKEQTLADGGHYERTPQYHALMLENYLDLYNLSLSNPSLFDDQFVALLKSHCVRGLQFYQNILFPDQQPPLLNDTAFDSAPSLKSLSNYFYRLSGMNGLMPSLDSIVSLPASGIYAYRHGDDMLVIDAGDVGPAYQPGHTHCDMLSYELMLGGKRIVVDTGVCEYEPGEVRQQLRSTRSHNTVAVGGAEQSEVWGEFRVARRAKILAADITALSNNVIFKGAYRGFHAVGRKVEHHRCVTIYCATAGDIEAVEFVDKVSGANGHLVEGFIHLHPDVMITEFDERVLQLQCGTVRCQIELAEGVNYYLEDSQHFPRFGVYKNNTRVVLTASVAAPNRLSYTIKKLAV